MNKKQKKILFLIDSLKAVGGAEQMFIDQANYFFGKGIEVYMATVLPTARVGDFFKALSPGIKKTEFHFRGFFDVKEYFKLRRYLSENKIDIIYSFLDFSNIIARALKILRPRTRIVLVEPGSPLRRGKIMRILEWPMDFLVYKILALSNDVRDKLISYLSVHRKKIVAIRNGVYPMLSREETAEKINNGSVGSFNVLHISNLKTENKGHAGMIRALGVVHKSRPDIPLKFWLVGDGPMRKDLEKLAEEEGLQNTAVFCGAVPHNEVKEYCREADVFIFNSRTEGGAQAVMEAESAALPIITSDFNSVHEVVVNGQNGFIVPRDDTRKFAEHIIQLYDNPELRREMGENSRKFYEEKFAFEFWTERFIDEIFN